MRLAYLILAHEKPERLARLIRALRSKDVRFFIHIDARVALTSFDICHAPDVYFCEDRVSCAWGNISLVDATLTLVRLALRTSCVSDRYVLLSGVCYPIQPPRYIDAFFKQYATTEFIECFPFPNPLFGKPIERLTRIWIKRAQPLLGLKWRVQHLLMAYGPDRNYHEAMGGLVLSVGSQWWALTHDALEWIVDFIQASPAFYRFCRYTDCPDEFVFQTIVVNSPFRAQISHALTDARWRPGSSGPDAIDDEMLARFRSARVIASADNNSPNAKREVLFARKTGTKEDQVEVLDKILSSKAAAFESSLTIEP